ncbi:hypothetical protein O3J30_004175 [Escherichia coli]|nr:hypothetical protein [Escherichia coli]
MTDSINANVVVSMPSQLFTMARSFKAVANGKIYIGKIDTDPVNPENQIQVYVENEDGSHIPVSQPIIINAAGYPVYNGQIAKFVTVQGHSMAVYDAYGSQQFYFPNVLKYDPDQFEHRLASSGGDKLIGSSYGGTIYSDYKQSIFVKKGDFSSGVTISSKNDAYLYTDGLWYVWTGELPHTISSSETPNVETTKWACVGLLNGYRINEVKNFIEEPGITNDSPVIKLAIYSLVRLGYGELIVTANSKVNIITEVAIPFAIDGIPVSIGIRGEGVINSLGNVPEIRVGLNSRGIVFGNVCYSLDRLVISQYVGSENTDVISKTSNTITLASNPFQANGGNIITWPLTDNNTAGVPVSNFCQFSTNSGSFFATGLVNNSDGSSTLTGVTGCNGTPSSEISNVTKVVRFTSRAHQLPDDTYPRTATCISLDVIENPTISNLWVLQTYRTFSFKDGNGGGEGSGLGHYGMWNDIIVDGTKEFVGGTDLSGGSIQGIEGGQFVNIHLFGTKYGFRGRRMKSCMFSNCTHYAFTGGKIFDILEVDGFSWVGGSIGWNTGSGYISNVMDCVNGDNITFTGVKFGRHHTTESGPAFKCSSRFTNFSFTGNSHESVSEGGFTDIGFFDVNEFSRSSIGENAIGFNGNGQPTLTMSTSAHDIARFAGTRFNQPVLTNAPAGIYDNEHTSGKGTFYSTSDYRDSGKILIIPDINSASPWPDDSRNIIKFGGTLSPGKTLMLPELTILNGTLLRSRVLLDLSSVNFNSQTIGIYNGPTLITTLSSQGIYEFISVGSTYYRIK